MVFNLIEVMSNAAMLVIVVLLALKFDEFFFSSNYPIVSKQ